MNTATALVSRKFTSLDALTRGELLQLVDLAAALARADADDEARSRPLADANVAVVYGQGGHLRATAFAAAARALGAQVAEIASCPDDPEWPSPPLLGRLYDAIDCEGIDAATVRAIDRGAGVPVFDELAAEGHPAHVVAALLHLRGRVDKPLDMLALALAGDTRTAFAQSLVRGATLAGVEVRGHGERAPDIVLDVGMAHAGARDLHRFGIQAVLLTAVR